MCGIAGFFGRSSIGTGELLRRMNGALQHRGPDASGTWFDPDRRAGLAHRRLAIVDLSDAGRQPMEYSGGRYVLSFNGEIYNFMELRSELSKRSHQFRGTSDTEVMLAAFEEWGITEAVSRFNGMFAVAVWDRIQNTGFLFRDRLGVKPLYYQWHTGALFFSSELTAPFADISPRSISRDSLALFLEYGYTSGQQTIYEGILKLQPGVIVSISVQSAASHVFDSSFVYWDTKNRINELLASRDERMDEAEAVGRINTALSRSVSQRMIADVPLGAFLSGGIDSSLVVAHMQQASTRPVRTFTIGFDNEAADEAPYAKKIAARLGTDHTELYVTEQDALNVIPDLPQIYGEPFADSSQIPTFLLSKLTRSQVTVALSGDGGDELFAGYTNYMTMRKYRRVLELLPQSALRGFARMLEGPAAQRAICSVVGERYFSRIASAARLYFAPAPGSPFLSSSVVKDWWPAPRNGISHGCSGNSIEQMMCRDLNAYLPDDILVKVDRASMAVALEIRAPFVDDFELFESAWQIPFRHKLDKRGGKLILKKALEGFVPRTLFDRPKKGFAVPLHAWLSGTLSGWVNDCIAPDRLTREGYLDSTRVAFIREQALTGDIFYTSRLWSICMFQSWLETQTPAAVGVA